MDRAVVLPIASAIDQRLSWRVARRSSARLLPGLVAATALAGVAWALGREIPLVGAPVLALALGIGLAALRQPATMLQPGLRWAGRYVLQGAIVALGATLSLTQVTSVGVATLPVMAGTLAAALGVSLVAGRALGVPPRLRTLVGAGTGICGASAIAAVCGVIAATEAEIAYAVSTIFVFNLVAVVLFPPIGHLLGMSQPAFGLWAGTAVNDTSSVVAAGYAYGATAGAHAVVVKLTRTTMIVPLVAALAMAARRRDRSGGSVRWTAIVPWFLLWFAAASALRTVGAIPDAWRPSVAGGATFLITVALAAIGLSTRLGEMRRAGRRPLLLGTLVWLAVALTGLGLQSLVGP